MVFPDIEQEVIVFVGEKGQTEKGIRIIEVNDLDELSQIDLSQNGFQRMQHVKEKWTKYFVSSDEMELIQTIRSDERFDKFSNYGIINIGITTGNNNYFSVTDDVVKAYNLENATLPLIGRSSHAHGIYFTQKDWIKNKNSGKRAMLVNFPDYSYDRYPTGWRDYIAFGESTDEHKGISVLQRQMVYSPSVWIPDCIFSTKK